MSVAEGNAQFVFDDNTTTTFGTSKNGYSGTINKNIKHVIIGPYTSVLLSDTMDNNWFLPRSDGSVSSTQTTVGPINGKGQLQIAVMNLGSGQHTSIKRKEHFGASDKKLAVIILLIIIIVITAVIFVYICKQKYGSMCY
jgi:hypothetical protein